VYRNSPSASPLVLFILGNKVEACDRRTGAGVWQYQASGDGAAFRVPIRCVVEEDRVVVASMGYPTGSWSGNAKPVTACLEYLTGRLLWRVELPIETSPEFANASVLVDAGQIMIACAGSMFAMSLADGTPQWQRRGHAHAMLAGLAIPGKDVQIDSKGNR
jgi:outer membrane protein assembly factor BamB